MRRLPLSALRRLSLPVIVLAWATLVVGAACSDSTGPDPSELPVRKLPEIVVDHRDQLVQD